MKRYRHKHLGLIMTEAKWKEMWNTYEIKRLVQAKGHKHTCKCASEAIDEGILEEYDYSVFEAHFRGGSSHERHIFLR